MASNDIISCRTVQAFSTIYTILADDTPFNTTVDLITQFLIRFVSGLSVNDLTKSSKTTTLRLLRHVGRKLRAAENIPRDKKILVNPRSSPKVSITKNDHLIF